MLHKRYRANANNIFFNFTLLLLKNICINGKEIVSRFSTVREHFNENKKRVEKSNKRISPLLKPKINTRRQKYLKVCL